MRALFKAALLAGVAWSATTTMAMAQDQTPATDETSSVEEVVVTARRTEETLQRVPASVTAFSATALERLAATDATSLQGAVPNLNIVQGRGSSNATNIYIRGVGQPDALQTFDPAVGVYVDDVYFSRIRGTQFDLLDLERVEVLRGPQGTLYGKNTIGGALKFVTRKPGQDFRGSASATIGDYNQRDFKVAVSGPVSDTLAFGVAALSSTRDGYVTDPVTNQEYNDKNTQAVRAAVAWTPSDRMRWDFSADYSRDDAGMTVGQPTSTLTTILGVPLLVIPNPPAEYNFQTRTTPGLPNSTKLKHSGVSAIGTFELSDNLTLKSITAYRKLNTDDYIDIDATQLELGDVFVGVDQKQTSQEFQLNWTTDRWTTVGGVYWLNEQITSHQEAYADQFLGAAFGNPTFTRTIDDDLELDSWAAYVNTSFQATDALRFSVGLRYTKEDKTYSRSTSTFSSNALFTANPAFAFSGLNQSWEDVSPMASVDYQFNDNVMGYARVSKGFKSGGFNGRANNPGEQAPYDPETVVSWEAGLKTQAFDRRLTLNLAAFTSKYKDFQARVSGMVIDPGTGLPSPELTVINAGEMQISGVELELKARPVPELLLESEIGYLDGGYEDFDDARFTAFGGSRAFQTPAFSPEWTARYAGSYDFSLGEAGSIQIGAQARYRSEMALAIDNTPTNSAVHLPGMWQDSYWLYDARVVWSSESGRYTAGLYGKNLSDEVYKTDAQEFSSVGGIRTAYYGAPKTFSFTVTARW
jgi:iron complex outermembrane receptor protein